MMNVQACIMNGDLLKMNLMILEILQKMIRILGKNDLQIITRLWIMRVVKNKKKKKKKSEHESWNVTKY